MDARVAAIAEALAKADNVQIGVAGTRGAYEREAVRWLVAYDALVSGAWGRFVGATVSRA